MSLPRRHARLLVVQCSMAPAAGCRGAVQCGTRKISSLSATCSRLGSIPSAPSCTRAGQVLLLATVPPICCIAAWPSSGRSCGRTRRLGGGFGPGAPRAGSGRASSARPSPRRLASLIDLAGPSGPALFSSGSQDDRRAAPCGAALPLIRDDVLRIRLPASGRLARLLRGRRRGPHHVLDDLEVAAVQPVEAFEALAHELALQSGDLAPVRHPAEGGRHLEVVPGLLAQELGEQPPELGGGLGRPLRRLALDLAEGASGALDQLQTAPGRRRGRLGTGLGHLTGHLGSAARDRCGRLGGPLRGLSDLVLGPVASLIAAVAGLLTFVTLALVAEVQHLAELIEGGRADPGQ